MQGVFLVQFEHVLCQFILVNFTDLNNLSSMTYCIVLSQRYAHYFYFHH